MTDKNFDDLSFDKYSDDIELDDGNFNNNNNYDDDYHHLSDDNDDSDILDEQLGYNISQNKNGRGGRRKREIRSITPVGEFNSKDHYKNQRPQQGKQYIKSGNKDYYSKTEDTKYYEKDNYYKKSYKDYNYSSTRYDNYNSGYKSKKYGNINSSYKKDNYKTPFKDNNYSKHGNYYNNHYDQGKYSMKANEKTPYYSNKNKKYENGNGKNYSKQNRYKKQGKGDFMEIEVELSDPPKEEENYGVEVLNINAEEFIPKSFMK